MDVNPMDPKTPPSAVGSGGRRRNEERPEKRHLGASGHDAHSGAPPAERNFDDEVSLLGIPRKDLSAPVRAAIQELFDEINELRQKLYQSRGHEAYLERQVEEDATLGVLNRRALLGRLARLLAYMAQNGGSASFVYIVMRNVGEIHLVHGHGAASRAMVEAASALKEVLRDGEVLGMLDASGFGVILPTLGAKEARARGEQLARVIAARIFFWNTTPVRLGASYGAYEIAPEDDINSVIDAVDADLIARFKEEFS
ncbi:GGDEF domain-containing protein [Varunaivibrio sulfuroxidans]|uniref:GGDEF domain-containing protein n=1 Tax=Varunaivibrio sulfuroxidans TaxID=1773489 RepID=A0A4V6NYJ0_9PROT|nr:diguanylate cyclase [Varunaivibrio sulfuroxidans]TCS63111.1 GGDEF domain-containing protein [Varunaivibrio sulfuroxidans]WES31817.1 diguanylate cyclase [Varunaivibrio sulfuroxidans]